ncbi:MAG: c-type cytochrome biogenesis protein CcmI [Candidatus Accumulibacter delftensis]|jgi:cytochrome c-type biogenesis protein CcmH
MTSFILFAALLVVAVIAILLPPLLARPPPSTALTTAKRIWPFFATSSPNSSASATNGSLALADFEQAQNELQRRLLDEVSQRQARRARPARAARPPSPCSSSCRWLPQAATRCSATQALDPLQRQARITPSRSRDVAGLVEKLKKNPDDSKGWVMLARSYKVLERYPEAAEAYGRAGALVDQDPALLADYAEVLSEVMAATCRANRANWSNAR